ncbi:MAG: hypothetical protein E6Q97_24860 [Desulfurellales bacterium]|nr:MAG: hypothetical protein E6Q97_24860 [Desulfurellales bacterium]
MMATRQALTPAAVNRRLDAMNRKKNPAITGELSYTEGLKLLATGRALSFYPRKGEISIDGFKRYSASAETIKKLRSARAEMLSSPSRSKRDWLPSENPATKKTRRVTVVAANPARKNPARDSSIPGDFSQSSAKVYGRAWTDAKSAALKDFGDAVQVRLTWPDGEWLQMLFDDKPGAMKHLRSLGFAASK